MKSKLNSTYRINIKLEHIPNNKINIKSEQTAKYKINIK